MKRAALALLGSALLLGALLLLLAPPGSPAPPPPPPSQGAEAPASPPAQEPSPNPTPARLTEPFTLPPPGVEGRPQAGTLFVQLELSPDSARLLHLEVRPELPFRLRKREGRFALLLEGAAGTRASLRFEAQALASAGRDEVHGDELKLAVAPVLLKLPRVQLPARLRIFSPSGTLIGDLRLRAP